MMLNCKCKCGYCFASPENPHEKEKHKTFAVIDDDNYSLFMKREIRAHKSRGKAAMRAVDLASALVSTLCVCPICSRIYCNLLEPDRQDGIECFIPDGVIYPWKSYTQKEKNAEKK